MEKTRRAIIVPLIFLIFSTVLWAIPVSVDAGDNAQYDPLFGNYGEQEGITVSVFVKTDSRNSNGTDMSICYFDFENDEFNGNGLNWRGNGRLDYELISGDDKRFVGTLIQKSKFRVPYSSDTAWRLDNTAYAVKGRDASVPADNGEAVSRAFFIFEPPGMMLLGVALGLFGLLKFFQRCDRKLGGRFRRN